jgi:hypothetical protein
VWYAFNIKPITDILDVTVQHSRQSGMFTAMAPCLLPGDGAPPQSAAPPVIVTSATRIK